MNNKIEQKEREILQRYRVYDERYDDKLQRDIREYRTLIEAEVREYERFRCGVRMKQQREDIEAETRDKVIDEVKDRLKSDGIKKANYQLYLWLEALKSKQHD